MKDRTCRYDTTRTFLTRDDTVAALEGLFFEKVAASRCLAGAAVGGEVGIEAEEFCG